MRGLQSHEKVDVIDEAPHLQRLAVQAAYDSTHIFVQPRSPLLFEEGVTIFRAEDQVVVKTGVSGWHDEPPGTPPGCGDFTTGSRSGGASLALGPPATGWHPCGVRRA